MDQDYKFNFRLSRDLFKAAKKLCRRDQVKYYSIGHIARIALIQFLKKEGVIDEAGRLLKDKKRNE